MEEADIYVKIVLREDKVLQKAFSKICKNLNTKITQQGLKEIFLNGKD